MTGTNGLNLLSIKQIPIKSGNMLIYLYLQMSYWSLKKTHLNIAQKCKQPKDKAFKAKWEWKEGPLNAPAWPQKQFEAIQETAVSSWYIVLPDLKLHFAFLPYLHL